jgi:uncharacterized protein YjlB
MDLQKRNEVTPTSSTCLHFLRCYRNEGSAEKYRRLARSAHIAFGGPKGDISEEGDIVVIPASVGHKNVGCSADFSVLGAYPRRRENYDLHTGEESERPEVLENIRVSRCRR